MQTATVCFVRRSAISSSNHVLWRNSIACRVLFQCRNVCKNFSWRSIFFLKAAGSCHTTVAFAEWRCGGATTNHWFFRVEQLFVMRNVAVALMANGTPSGVSSRHFANVLCG